MRVIERYAARFKGNRGKLMLVGVSEPVYHQLEKTDLLNELGQENVYKATSIMGGSALKACQDAKAWLMDGEQQN
jgi:sulfate permease, SulP family